MWNELGRDELGRAGREISALPLCSWRGVFIGWGREVCIVQRRDDEVMSSSSASSDSRAVTP